MTSVPIELPDEPGWSTVTVGGIHLLVRAGGAMVERVRAAAEGGDLDDVLDALSRDGVRATPDFVAVLEGSPLRVVTRGSAYAVGSGPDGPSEIRATGRGPWVDQDAAERTTGLVLHTGSPRPAPAATTLPAAEPQSGSGGGWKLPSVFGRNRDPEQPAEQSAPPPAPPAEDAGEVEDLPSYDHLFGVPDTWEPVSVPAVAMAARQTEQNADFTPNVIVRLGTRPALDQVADALMELRATTDQRPDARVSEPQPVDISGQQFHRIDVSWSDPQFGVIRQVHAFTSLVRDDVVQDFVHITGSTGGAAGERDLAVVEQVILSAKVTR